jgi:putative membrane protein
MADNVTYEVRMTSDSHFSWLRTRMSLERTLMSWIRTGVSLVGFGFTIVQFLDRLGQMPGAAPAAHAFAARAMGLSMIGAGTLAMILSTWQYNSAMNYLWSDEFLPLAGIDHRRRHTPILMVAILLILVGIGAFMAVLLRLP